MKVDHRKVECGVYQVESKVTGEEEVITFDINFGRTEGKPVRPLMETLHSVEHILNYYISNVIPDGRGFRKVYFGIKGCRTGFVLITISPVDKMKPERVIMGSVVDACRIALNERIVPMSKEVDCPAYWELKFTDEVDSLLNKILLMAKNVVNVGLSTYPVMQ